MGEKDVDVKKEGGENKMVDPDNTKKVDEGPITIVLKLDLHCAGCAKKIKKSIQCIEGVKTVKADSVNNKLTITGKVDPVHIKERVEFKTKKKVEIISPKPKKEDESVKKDDDKPPEAKSNDKPKEPQSTTVVLKIPLHCDGCAQKIKRIISKIDGVETVKPDANKNLVTVKGTMNVKELVPYLKDKLKRNVDIVPQKEEDKGKKEEPKDGEKTVAKKVEEGDGKSKKDGDNNDDEKKKNDTGKYVDNGGGEEKKKNEEAKAATIENEKKKSNDEAKTDDGDGGGGTNEGKNVDVINKFEYYRHNPHIYTMPVYNQSYYNQDYGALGFSNHGYGNEGYANHGYVMEYPRRPLPLPTPMSLNDPSASNADLFSVENPNACSIM